MTTKYKNLFAIYNARWAGGGGAFEIEYTTLIISYIL
jgi:hypothetical protein